MTPPTRSSARSNLSSAMRSLSLPSLAFAGVVLPASADVGAPTATHSVGFAVNGLHRTTTLGALVASSRCTQGRTVLGGVHAASTAAAPPTRKRDIIRNFVADIWWTIVSAPRNFNNVSPDHFDGDRYFDRERWEDFDKMEVDFDLMEASMARREHQAKLLFADMPSSASGKQMLSNVRSESVLAVWENSHPRLFNGADLGSGFLSSAEMRAGMHHASADSTVQAAVTPIPEAAAAVSIPALEEQSAAGADYRSSPIMCQKTLRGRVEQLLSRTERVAETFANENPAASLEELEHAAELNQAAKRLLKRIEGAPAFGGDARPS